MMQRAGLIACTLLLAACSNEPEVDARNASAAEVAKKVRAAGGTSNFVNPGRWESTVTIEDMTIPGMPPQAAAQMKEATGQAQTNLSCLTEEEAKRPNEDFFTGDNKNCRYDRFTMAGGKIDAVMKCSDVRTTQTVTLQGNYSGDTYNMRMSLAGEAGTAGAMRMKMRVDAKRVGECDGSEDA